MVMPAAKSSELEHGVDVASPCVGICKYAPNEKVCIGCGRTDEEIASWMFLSNSEKQQVIEKSTQRESFVKNAGIFWVSNCSINESAGVA